MAIGSGGDPSRRLPLLLGGGGGGGHPRRGGGTQVSSGTIWIPTTKWPLGAKVVNDKV